MPVEVACVRSDLREPQVDEEKLNQSELVDVPFSLLEQGSTLL